MSRCTKIAATFGAVSVLFAVGPQRPNAQTPAQMEYERQQREYRQQQEQQRQEQQRLQQLQNDNARRQQEESNRAARQLAPGSVGPNYPSPSASPPSPASGGGRSAVPGTAASERRYALPGQDFFVVQIPGSWKDQMQQARDGSSTIVLSPASGKRFEVLLTPTSSTKGRATESREDIRAAVERAAQGAKLWAAESQLLLKEIQGRSGTGFYFSATERAPKAGAHKFVTTGILRVGDRLVPFTILTHEGQASIVSQALDLLKTAALDSASGTAAAPRAPPASGTSTVNSPATHTLRLNSYYTCNGERVAVLRCRSETDDAYCSVQYPDRKSAATGGMTPELAERRAELVKKLEQCQPPKS